MTDNVLLTRHHTEVLLDMVTEGIFDPLDVLKAALCWMSDDQVRRIQELSLAAFRAVDGAGMARVDFLLSGTSGDLFVNATYFITASGSRRTTTYMLDGASNDEAWGRQTMLATVPACFIVASSQCRMGPPTLSTAPAHCPPSSAA